MCLKCPEINLKFQSVRPKYGRILYINYIFIKYENKLIYFTKLYFSDNLTTYSFGGLFGENLRCNFNFNHSQLMGKRGDKEEPW